MLNNSRKKKVTMYVQYTSLKKFEEFKEKTGMDLSYGQMFDLGVQRAVDYENMMQVVLNKEMQFE